MVAYSLDLETVDFEYDAKDETSLVEENDDVSIKKKIRP